jgi:hypothetical protein
VASRYPTRAELAAAEPPEPGDEDDEGAARGRQRPVRKPMKSTRGKHRQADVQGRVSPQQWHEMRETCFKRSGQRCDRCGKPRSQAYRFDPHHRKLIRRGGPDQLSNLAALCDECHGWCHANNDEAEAAGWIVASWADPHALAVTLHDGRAVLFDDQGGYAWEGRPLSVPAISTLGKFCRIYRAVSLCFLRTVFYN